MTKQNLRALLMDCAEKLNLYRGQHSGEYIGGVEYMELQRRIVKALDELRADEPGDRNITTVGGIERFPVLQSGLMDTAPDVLKPCPFCGHEAAFKDSGVKGHDHFCVRVCCSNGSCGVCTPEHYKTREAAAMAWNRRSVNREAGQ